jgi:hypothetical protein
MNQQACANEVHDKLVGKHADKEFQPSFLHEAETRSMIPIHFAGGLTVGECNRYDDFIEAKSLSSGLVSSIHRPAVAPLTKQANGRRPSCLRQAKQHRSVEAHQLRRSASFSNLPRDNLLMTKALKSLSIMDTPVAPKVRFEAKVLVTHIPSHTDLPDVLRQKIWMSRDELQLSMREARLEEIRERKQWEIADLQEESMSDLQFNAADDIPDEEASMDFMDLATSMSFTDKENSTIHNVLDGIDDPAATFEQLY